MAFHQIRIARASSDLNKILRFYGEGLGLDILYRFQDHEGYDGVMLGRRGDPFHLEFTMEEGAEPTKAPTKENLLVFYYKNKEDLEVVSARMDNLGFRPVTSHNPYWDRGGKTYEDFEGYRVVLFLGSF